MKARWDYILDSVHGNDAVIDVEKWFVKPITPPYILCNPFILG